ncbi:metallophosphoesterase [Paenibacillus rigui]|uniref:Metallophosphoesterase n=2 Tax=Paenibacillus rigui TaxID=554312 RepID=A0A229UHQ2_9BACL|nr:metallophosphoesterase [Paenibacillus rigui]
MVLLLLGGCTSNGGGADGPAPNPSQSAEQGGSKAASEPPGRTAEGAAAGRDKPFRFVVMGDSRGSAKGANEAILRNLMEHAKGLNPVPSLLFFTGDQVTGGANVGAQLEAWKAVVDDYFPMTSVYPALGNHEHDEKVFSEVFSHLPKEQLPGYGKTVYSFDYGNARFITLNSDRQNKNNQYAMDQNQRNWLEQQLKSSGDKQVFVQFHMPAYPIGAHLGSSLDGDPVSRDALWSLLDRYRVTAVFVGHEHNYNRRKVDGSFDGNGHHFEHPIYQLTIGGAGAPLYSGSQESKQVVVGPKASYHYMVVDVEADRTVFKAYDLQQNEIDSFTVERGGL